MHIISKKLLHEPFSSVHVTIPAGFSTALLRYYIWFRYFWQSHTIPLTVAAFSVLGLLAAGLFYQGGTVPLSYASSNSCVNKFVLLPNLHKTQGNDVYSARLSGEFHTGNLPLFSRQLCITPTGVPAENSSEKLKIAFFGASFINQTIKVTASTYPKLETAFLSEAPISVREPLQISLSQADALFDYALQVNDKTVLCAKDTVMLSCPVDQLQLTQGTTYELGILRMYGGKTVGSANSVTIQTINSLDVLATSIAAGSTVFDKPLQLRIDLNKKVASLGVISMKLVEGGEPRDIPTTVTTEAATIVITFSEALPRNAKFEVTMDGLVAEDKGILTAPYVLQFYTSGGPKVASSNIKNYAMEASQNLELTFDQDLLPGQDIAKHLTFTVAGAEASFTATVQGRRLILNPTSDMPRCATFSLTIDNEIQNTAGISGSSAKSYNSRVRCAALSTIGYSVRGRAITAHTFGTGSSKILFVGGTHGNETSSKYTLDAWINELEANPTRIPANRTIVVIPNLNPDGYAASSRTNANGVDLNRNFPASDWQAGVYMPGGVYSASGGGSEALSEPESRALANYVQAHNPRLVLTYHATAAVVIRLAWQVHTLV